LQAQTAPAPTQTTAPQTDPSQSLGAQTAPVDNPDRKKALELRSQGRMVEAMPLFEILCAEYPKDAAMWEGWAVSTIGYSQTLTDPELRKKARGRARTDLLKAKELGDNSPLLQTLLSMIPEDGGEMNFSPRKEVNDAMQQAEADFGRGDYDKAREGYLRALLLEPKNYDAALFIGDVYFKQHINGSADEWFAKAVEIDPNRETAYRYWGDALAAMGKNSEAREKYIQAIVADPYNNRCWVGLNQWAQRNKVRLNWVKLQDKSRVSTEAGKTNITVEASSEKNDPATAAWTFYGMARTNWQWTKFKQEFPNEPKYRRTLREETDALRGMVEILSRPENAPRLDPTLAALVNIDQEGFIEPFALLNRADKDIAQDYAPYRDAHRETIYKYFDEFVVPKAPVKLGE
jgi:tetratricopeptide (TPR) repeat protein